MARIIPALLVVALLGAGESPRKVDTPASTSRPVASSAPSKSLPATRPAQARRPRVPTRKLRSTQEYDELAKWLRDAYSKPPVQWPKPTIDPGVEYVELGLLRKPAFPPENPFSEAKSDLGLKLFFDPRLSGSQTIACASCHEPELGWADGRAVSFGHERSPNARNAPTLVNVAHRRLLFWDGRAETLEDQAHGPIEASNEMNADDATIVKRLGEQPGYRAAFKAAFGDETITMERVAQALATYQRTIVSRPSAFDKFLSGQADALSDAAVRGLHLFRTDARCANCHMGPTLSDERFHDLGLSYYGRKLQDLGRYEITKDPADVGRFKTPTLRNIPRTAPYMHNGLFDLPGVLNMYNAGMVTQRRDEKFADDPLYPTKSEHLRPLGLNDRDLADLLAFLESLEEVRLRIRPPELPGIGPSATTTSSAIR